VIWRYPSTPSTVVAVPVNARLTGQLSFARLTT
jgi:hypothetical protein